MENSRNPNFYGIGDEDDEFREFLEQFGNNSPKNSLDRFARGAETNSDSRRDIPAWLAVARKRANDRRYRSRKRFKELALNNENAQLKDENESLKREIQLLSQKIEIQSKELDGLRKMCDNLEEKCAEEHERNQQLQSDLKTRGTIIESLSDVLVELKKQRSVNPTSENRSNEMDAPLGNLSSGR